MGVLAARGTGDEPGSFVRASLPLSGLLPTRGRQVALPAVLHAGHQLQVLGVVLERAVPGAVFCVSSVTAVPAPATHADLVHGHSLPAVPGLVARLVALKAKLVRALGTQVSKLPAEKARFLLLVVGAVPHLVAGLAAPVAPLGALLPF